MRTIAHRKPLGTLRIPPLGCAVSISSNQAASRACLNATSLSRRGHKHRNPVMNSRQEGALIEIMHSLPCSLAFKPPIDRGTPPYPLPTRAGVLRNTYAFVSNDGSCLPVRSLLRYTSFSIARKPRIRVIVDDRNFPRCYRHASKGPAGAGLIWEHT